MGIKVFLRKEEKMLPESEQIKILMKKFKKACEGSNIIKDYKRHAFYEKPSDRKRRERAAKKKNMKRYSRLVNKQADATFPYFGEE